MNRPLRPKPNRLPVGQASATVREMDLWDHLLLALHATHQARHSGLYYRQTQVPGFWLMWSTSIKRWVPAKMLVEGFLGLRKL